LVFRVNDID
jgi:hypothetical protein